MQTQTSVDTPISFTSGLGDRSLVTIHRSRFSLGRALQHIGEGLSPRTCAACRRPLFHGHAPDPLGALCGDCRETLEAATLGGCERCGAVTMDGQRHRPGWLCRVCVGAPPPYRRAVGAWRYGGALRDAIIAWKNRPAFHLSRPLTDLLLTGLSSSPGDLGAGTDLIVPVPTTRVQLARRGFNPAAMLAEGIQRQLRATEGRRVPLACGAIRVCTSADRASSSKDAARTKRLSRARGSFVAEAGLVAGRRVWLVDDVMTTGATVSACAQALLEAGAREVDVVVLARVEGLRSV